MFLEQIKCTLGLALLQAQRRAGLGYLLLQNVNLPLLHVQHVFQISDLSRQRALLVRQVLQLFGLLGQELLLLLQPHTQSVNLGKQQGGVKRADTGDPRSGPLL